MPAIWSRPVPACFAIFVAMAGFVAMPGPVEAESPFDFFRNLGRRPVQTERDEPVARAEPRRGGFFSRFFEIQRRPAPPAVRAARRQATPAAPQGFQRVLCRRTCDGQEFALGILPSSPGHKQAAAMCTAAGGGLETTLVVENFVSGQGFAPVVTAGAPRLVEGRAAASPDAPAVSATCGEGPAPEPFMVPLLNDATLRHGDIVATETGFRVFIGRGEPPFKPTDFVDGNDRRLPAEVRRMEIAER